MILMGSRPGMYCLQIWSLLILTCTRARSNGAFKARNHHVWLKTPLRIAPVALVHTSTLFITTWCGICFGVRSAAGRSCRRASQQILPPRSLYLNRSKTNGWKHLRKISMAEFPQTSSKTSAVVYQLHLARVRWLLMKTVRYVSPRPTKLKWVEVRDFGISTVRTWTTNSHSRSAAPARNGTKKTGAAKNSIWSSIADGKKESSAWGAANRSKKNSTSIG